MSRSSRAQLYTIFWQFLKLGCVSFGGPAAHLANFQRVFVEQRQWLDDSHWQRLFSLSHFLPGPSSSQVGFAIGYHRAGIAGGLLAFVAFTAPSALLLLLLSYSTVLNDHPLFLLIQQSAKLLIVVVVADALFSMGRHFCRSYLHATIAVIMGLFFLFLNHPGFQLGVLVFAGVLGYGYYHITSSEAVMKTKRLLALPTGLSQYSAVLFIILFIFSLLPFSSLAAIQLFQDFFRAGSLVFGGGHVVLPLLQSLVADSLPTETFLLGYGAAQIIPGPIFSVASFLGTELFPQYPPLGAVISLMAIFLPGFLLLLIFYSYWEALSSRKDIAAAIGFINASVVGLLASTWISPIVYTSISSFIDIIIVLVGFFLLRQWRWSIGLVIAWILMTVFAANLL